jgi:N-acetylglucosaminyldiphosphoundecaprenol N-acetyl-beta-D-mannosaminyltransferase
MSAPPPRLLIGGAPVDPCTFREAVARIVERASSGLPPAYVVTPNAHHVSLLRDSEAFRRVYDGAWLSLADGMPLVWASRILGSPVPEKVSGSDLFPALCKAIAGTQLRVFLLGGLPGSAEGAARVLESRYPGLRITGSHCPPYGFEHDPVEGPRAIAAVREAAPHLLFVALGAPKQELWMHDNRERLGVPVSIGVGGSFEFVAGMVRRAPKWMRRSGLEWLFRLGMEPRRLWKRYLVTNTRFLGIVAGQYATRRRAPPGPR